MNELYLKLGLKINNDKQQQILHKSIKRLFKIRSISSFNPYLSLFSIRNIDNKTFNNKHQIIKLINKKTKKRVKNAIFKGLISVNNKQYFKNIFIKECPLFNPEHIQIDMSISEDGIYSYKNYLLYKFLYDLDNSCNTELFVNYLTSKLTELNICPHFALFYGYTIVIMNKFSQECNNSYIKPTSKIRLINNNNIYIERTNFPCLLLFTEKLDDELFNYFTNPNLKIIHVIKTL